MCVCVVVAYTEFNTSIVCQVVQWYNGVEIGVMSGEVT